MHEAEGGGGIELVGGVDARNAVGIEADIDRAGQAGNARLLLPRRQSEPEQASDQRRKQQEGKADTHQGTAEEAKQ